MQLGDEVGQKLRVYERIHMVELPLDRLLMFVDIPNEEHEICRLDLENSVLQYGFRAI